LMASALPQHHIQCLTVEDATRRPTVFVTLANCKIVRIGQYILGSPRSSPRRSQVSLAKLLWWIV
jgi:hypothetical protein